MHVTRVPIFIEILLPWYPFKKNKNGYPGYLAHIYLTPAKMDDYSVQGSVSIRSLRNNRKRARRQQVNEEQQELRFKQDREKIGRDNYNKIQSSSKTPSNNDKKVQKSSNRALKHNNESGAKKAMRPDCST